MRGQARSRLTGSIAELPEFSIPGLWVSHAEGQLNGLQIASETLLLPDMRGVMTWARPSEEITTVGFPSVEGGGLRLGSLDAALTGLSVEARTWEEWLSTSPMDSELADDLQRFPLEVSMEQELSHLEAVCRQARTHLEIYEERQLVSRARQIPVRAVNYLASHTEDWEARTLRGVRPRRVIANVRDDLYDIYENRVAARLVDHLTKYVRRRLVRIKELQHSLQTIDLNAQEPPSGMHWRQERIYRLWGEALDLTEAQLLASERLKELKGYLYRLERLRASLLYINVPAKAKVAEQLKITNILGNDPHYRRVARLWMSWYYHAYTGYLSLQEQQRTALHEACQFDQYARLLLIHALDQFEFVPVAGKTLKGQKSLQLHGPEGRVELLFNLDGTTSLYREKREVLRVVTSPIPLAELRSDELNHIVTTLKDEACQIVSQTVLLYPSTATELVVPALHTVSGDPARIHPNLSCLPVSPVDLESVERLARLLRWVLTGERLSAYPPTIEAKVTLTDIVLPDALHQRQPGMWKLLTSMTTRPRLWTEETRRRRQALSDAERELAQVEKSDVYMRRAQRKVDMQKREFENWKAFLAGIDAAEAAIIRIRRCPVCGTEQANFVSWPGDQFNCACHDCGAQWSLRHCQDCGQYHPWLMPHLRETPNIVTKPGWADRLYGRDVLTLPEPNQLDGYCCPHAD